MFNRFFQALATAFSKKKASSSVAARPSEDMLCPRCSESIKIAAKICRFCGFRIVSGTTSLMIDGDRKLTSGRSTGSPPPK